MVSVGVFASLLDLFIVNIAFPDLQRDFAGADLAELSWVLNSYAVVFAALLVPAGRMVDLYGRKGGFLVGLGLFTAASAACALAPTAGWLIAARAVQGAGAAILTPSSLGVVLHRFPPRSWAAIVSGWAAVGAVGAAAGPPLGGLLVQASWRWIFLVNLPLGLVSLWYVSRRVKESRDPAAGGLPDMLGTVALMGGVGALTLALVKGRDWGWATASTLVAFAAAALLVLTAVARSRRHSTPVLELPLLRVRSFAFAVASALVFSIAFAGLLLEGVLFLTEVWGHSVLHAGLELAPGPLAALVFAAAASRLGPRFGMTTVGAAGGIMLAAGLTITVALVDATPDFVGGFLPGQIVTGAGIGLAIPAFTSAAVRAVPPSRFATAIGISSMFRQVGAAIGVAVLVAILAAPAVTSPMTTFRTAWVVLAMAAGLGGLLMLGARRADR